MAAEFNQSVVGDRCARSNLYLVKPPIGLNWSPRYRPDSGTILMLNIRNRKLTKTEIISLADELGIGPGIVAGRYQFLTGKWNYFKGLIGKLKWAD
jgi:hypothetical protein